ncbi:MAG TPA: RagB/SusD family nutrient uptake outer membrane protein [Ohtaekwangia sp.]
MKSIHKFSVLFTAAILVLSGCSLDEELRSDISKETADKLSEEGTLDYNAMLAAAYNSTYTFLTQDRIWSLQEQPSDEIIPPTRGGNWDDNGDWRVLHAHKWNSEHTYITQSFNELLTGAYNSLNILQFEEAPADVKAQARFLMAFYYYHVLDIWGKFPYREPGSDLLQLPVTMEGAEAVDFLIAQTEQAMDALPSGSLANAGKANKNAAHALLAKLYLNRGTFNDRTAPTFADADMDKVVAHCDAIISSAQYNLTDIYFNNFTPDNSTVSTENIFVTPNTSGVGQPFGNGIQSRWFCTLNYAHNPSGWNGFATLGEFYDKFSDTDIRKHYEDPVAEANGGFNMGFLIGQQYDKDGNALANVVYTREVNLIEKGTNLDFTGIRVMKYRPDFALPFQPGNDYVHFRYADILLMKAEALLRSGNSGDALPLVNEIRNKRIEPDAPFASLTLDNLLDERGRELYWEGYRRQDLIRFGKFLDSRPTKPGVSDTRYLVFPIPDAQLAVNPNLKQNPGY